MVETLDIFRLLSTLLSVDSVRLPTLTSAGMMIVSALLIFSSLSALFKLDARGRLIDVEERIAEINVSVAIFLVSADAAGSDITSSDNPSIDNPDIDDTFCCAVALNNIEVSRFLEYGTISSCCS
jgi:hypothetical protein